MPGRFRISNELKDAIVGSPIRQHELGHLSGLHYSQVSRYLNGRRSIGLQVLPKILILADLLGVSAERAVRPCAR